MMIDQRKKGKYNSGNTFFSLKKYILYTPGFHFLTFRFHCTVVFIDAWKNIYRNRGQSNH